MFVTGSLKYQAHPSNLRLKIACMLSSVCPLCSQVATYTDDFNEERKSREKMAGERFQLEAELEAKSEEIRHLKMELDAQAAAANVQEDVSGYC